MIFILPISSSIFLRAIGLEWFNYCIYKNVYKQNKMEKLLPDYKTIYSDIIIKKFPQKKYCLQLLQKKSLSVVDIMELNGKIFGIPDKETFIANQKHRSYNKTDIFEILNYQKENKLNNNQLAIKFKLSRNTVTKWKKYFAV
ncbi:helix-turn-helix domain-containing protein [Chryseobacterium lathyri]|uniref:helix-turn-helix domain-containing protein n=1 Tax=Chryseobacterium lathyri TaxID=395933 RepID=UPI0027845552|nr:helix-turn-helix domain-containing protein [Chryseobacterium lathyri]MDQ0064389.1 hypothetical protein [Chryseobacterium lathyri]